MSSFAAVAVKVAGGGVAAALLSLGLAGGLAQAASPSPGQSTSTTTAPTTAASRADRRAVRLAVFESEADVLGFKPAQLRADLRHGQKVSDLAKDKGMTKDQFAAKLIANLRPRLEALVDKKVITQAQADRTIDRISKGHVPFWDGIHPRK
jgi:phage tail sheath protein FI